MEGVSWSKRFGFKADDVSIVLPTLTHLDSTMWTTAASQHARNNVGLQPMGFE